MGLQVLSKAVGFLGKSDSGMCKISLSGWAAYLWTLGGQS